MRISLIISTYEKPAYLDLVLASVAGRLKSLGRSLLLMMVLSARNYKRDFSMEESLNLQVNSCVSA
jgi:hypothetical protein